MDTVVIDQKREQLADVLGQIEVLASRDEYKPEDVEGLKARAESLKSQVSDLTDAMAMKAAAADMEQRLQVAARRQDAKTQELATLGESPGEVFTRSKAFTNYDGHGHSPRVDVGDFMTRAISLPIKTSDFPSALLAGSRYLSDATLLTPLLDLIPTVVTGLSAFPVWGTTVAEGGAAVVAEGDAKPPLDLAEAKIDVSLDMVAVYTQVTRQALEDIAMMRGMIDTQLRRAVLKKFEELAVTAVTAATLPTATAPASGGTLQGAIRLGVAKVQSAGWQPNAVAVNPQDAANIDIAALSLASGCCSDNFWNLRVVPVTGLTAGTAIVGDFTNGATTYARQAGVSVFITDSHAETFIHNVFTILAETRRKTVIERADAFAKVSVSSP